MITGKNKPLDSPQHACRTSTQVVLSQQQMCFIFSRQTPKHIQRQTSAANTNQVRIPEALLIDCAEAEVKEKRDLVNEI